ncbi:MAG: hypothetical protein AB1489_18405 [Acidobacteriota bacterium]
MPIEISRTTPTQVALVTCSELPNLDTDTQLLIAPLVAQGVSVMPVIWDDPKVNWTAFDLVVVRSCWDYTHRRAEFLSWASRVPRLSNPAEVLAWNTDKQYLLDLIRHGIPVIPTTWVLPAHQWHPPDQGEWVIKPTVSMASLDTGRYRMYNPDQHHMAVIHMQRLQNTGRTVMVQPYLDGVDTEGETSLVYIDGVFSHAMRKGTVLDGPDVGIDRRFQHNGGLNLQARQPTPAQLSLAEKVLTAVPGTRDRLLYARVDLLPLPDGTPVLIELELTEPQLYLGHTIGAADRLAVAIATQARSALL